ncbi:MAG: Flp pilus assembly protein CpaB [Propionibacteriaceae bacterium]|nr:Flp pilus assembly protein CpaB [Propionibacteriaceae bacterium]
MASTTLTPRRALRKPWRLDPRALFGLFLMLVSVGGSVVFWTTSTDTRAVLVATRDRPAGATLGLSDVVVTNVRVDDAIFAAAISAEEQATVVGRQLAEPLHAQQLLARAQLSGRPPLGPGQMALTIQVSPDTAAGGAIRPGDSVQVLVTTNKGRPESRTSVVLPRITVYDVGLDDQTTVINTGGSDDADRDDRGSISSLTLIVSQEQALQLTVAKWNGDLDVALLPAEGA